MSDNLSSLITYRERVTLYHLPLSESALTISKWLQTIDIFTSVWFLFAVIPSKQYFLKWLKGVFAKHDMGWSWIEFGFDRYFFLLLSGAYLRRKFSTFYPQATHGFHKNLPNSLKKIQGGNFWPWPFKDLKGTFVNILLSLHGRSLEITFTSL